MLNDAVCETLWIVYYLWGVYLIDPNTKYRSTLPQQSYTAVSNPPAHYLSKSPHKESLHPNIEISSDKPQHEIGNTSILSN